MHSAAGLGARNRHESAFHHNICFTGAYSYTNTNTYAYSDRERQQWQQRPRRTRGRSRADADTDSNPYAHSDAHTNATFKRLQHSVPELLHKAGPVIANAQCRTAVCR
jgi:hypothetical protein